METPMKRFSSEEYSEKDINLWRARLFTLDKMDRRKTITIKQETDDSLCDLRMQLQEGERHTYDELIVLCVQAYKELQVLKDRLSLNDMEIEVE